MIMTRSLIRQRLKATAGHADFETPNGITPLLSQTAASRPPGRTPWQSHRSGRRFTSQPGQRPTGRYDSSATPTGSHIQVGGSDQDPLFFDTPLLGAHRQLRLPQYEMGRAFRQIRRTLRRRINSGEFR